MDWIQIVNLSVSVILGVSIFFAEEGQSKNDMMFWCLFNLIVGFR